MTTIDDRQSLERSLQVGMMTLLIQRARPRSSLVPVITARRKVTKLKTAGRKVVVRLDSVPRGSGSQKGRVARTRLQLLMLMVVNLMEFGLQTQPPQMMKMTGSEKLHQENHSAM